MSAEEQLLLARAAEHRAKTWQWRMAAIKELSIGLLMVTLGWIAYLFTTKLLAAMAKYI